MRFSLSAFIVIAAVSAPLAAQHQHEASPYAAWKSRDIKSLAPEDIEGLRRGEGMSLALAAELNAYPGPRHVLEMAHMLNLTEDQTSRVQEIRDRMQAEARRLGEEIVTAERRLDRAFAERTIDAATLESLTTEIGRLRGSLRSTHLVAHIETAAVLDQEQREAYERARGYM